MQYNIKAANRVADILADDASAMGNGTVADLIADTIHYCVREGKCFEAELERAYGYVDADISDADSGDLGETE